MNISNIKAILSSGDILANQVNPIIDLLEINDLDKLSGGEKEALNALLCNMLRAIQDETSGAYLNSPKKAESLLDALRVNK